MPAFRSVLSSDLIVAIEDGAWVLARNQRSAHSLRLLYANHALAQGRTAWATPPIYSFDAFVMHLWRASGNGAERVLSTQQSRMLWERIVATSDWSALLISPQAAATTAFRSWERLQAWRIDRNSLAKHTDENVEAQALLDWSNRFDELCRRKGWLPEALLAERLLTANVSFDGKKIVTTGDELLPLQSALLNRIVENGVEWVRLIETSHDSVMSVAQCDSPERELQSAAVWARQQLVDGQRSIAVIVPNLPERAAETRRIFAEEFAQITRTFATDGLEDDRKQQGAFAIANYRRLVDFPVVQAALDLLRLAVGQASSTLVGGILRNPFWRASEAEAPARALADARLRSQVREHFDFAALERLTSLADCPVLSKCVSEAQAVRLRAPSRGLPSAMAEQFIALWRAFGWPGDRSPNSDEQQIVARMQACLAEFGALDDLLGQQTFQSAVREFEQLVRDVSFEPRSAPAPVNILDVHAIDGLQFDALWVAGMDETRWPPTAAPDAFIPIALQIAAGMPTATAQLAHGHARRRFDALCIGAEKVVLSWSSKDGDIEVLPSPWLHEMLRVAPARVATIASMPMTYAERMFAAKPTLESFAEPAAPPFTLAQARGGARIFELQSRCPFRAFAELRLDAKPLDGVVPNVDASERGTLIHAALADVWRGLGGSAALQKISSEQLTVQVRTALASQAKKLLDGASSHRVRMLQIEIDLATERVLALLELDRQRAAFHVVGKPETPEASRVGQLSFELRLDRMDELLDAAHRGERVIVDYKTGSTSSAQSWIRERPEQPQLPLYAVTHPQSLAAVAFATIEAKGVAYRGLARHDEILPGIRAFAGKDLPAPYAEWEGLMSYWRSVIERLANEFASGDARVDPLPSACRYCHLSTLCRIHEQATIRDEDSP
jgi:probable DNA repair protein